MSSDKRGIPSEDIVSWYFRDSRSTPLDLDHDVSGSDVSDDEDAVRNKPWDLAHLNEENCTRCAGFLLKQSSRDPNLWRKRFCILAVHTSFFIKLNSLMCMIYRATSCGSVRSDRRDTRGN